jgi:hypothetical protein
LIGTSSFTLVAITASYITSSAIVGLVPTSSYALTASFALNGGGGGGAQVIVSSSAPSGSPSGTLWYDDTDLTLYVRYQDASGSTWWAPSFTGVVASAISASYVETASYVQTITSSLVATASYVSGSNVDGTVGSSFTSSYALTASYALNGGGGGASSPSASWASSSISASYAETASFFSSYKSFAVFSVPNQVIKGWNNTNTGSFRTDAGSVINNINAIDSPNGKITYDVSSNAPLLQPGRYYITYIPGYLDFSPTGSVSLFVGGLNSPTANPTQLVRQTYYGTASGNPFGQRAGDIEGVANITTLPVNLCVWAQVTAGQVGNPIVNVASLNLPGYLTIKEL